MRCKMMLMKKSGRVCVSGCAKEGKAYAGKVYLCPKWVTSLSSELCFVEHAGFYIYIYKYICMCVCGGCCSHRAESGLLTTAHL